MIIGKFLDPRAPSLPQQVGINTDDIAEILQENEEQSANIQQNTDDIELLKQQVSESGTRVRVDGELVAEWSPDELTDDLQQLRLAQSSDSLAIVGLQSDNITNKNNIAKLDAETLKTPISPPANIEIVGIGTNNSQVMITIEELSDEIKEFGYEQNETVYDMSSSDSSKNWGYTAGLSNGVVINGKDLSKYKRLRCYWFLFGADSGIFELDLSHYLIEICRSFVTLNSDSYNAGIVIEENGSITVSTANPPSGDNYIYRIEGVY